VDDVLEASPRSVFEATIHELAEDDRVDLASLVGVWNLVADPARGELRRIA
jgi:hypothetical protein